MPVMDGFKACQAIRAINKSVPIVALSAGNCYSQYFVYENR